MQERPIQFNKKIGDEMDFIKTVKHGGGSITMTKFTGVILEFKTVRQAKVKHTKSNTCTWVDVEVIEEVKP